MSPRLRQPRSPARAVQVPITLGAAFAVGWSLFAYGSGRVPLGPGFGLAALALVAVGALTRRYGVSLPGNGFSSYVLGTMVFAILGRGWTFAAVVAPWAMILGDVFLRRLPLRAALGNAAHLTAGSALVGLGYGWIGGTVYISRMGVRADELQLIQRLSQAIAAEINLARSFQHIQDLTRRLVPWEHMGFARYDAKRREMELIADTATAAGGAGGGGQ